MTMIRKDLGTVTAYAYAVSKGYTGTEAEFAELMASYADVAEEAAQSASDAESAATRAEQAAATLTVDDALSDTSVNPVQNKVITGEITDVKSHLTVFTGNTAIKMTSGGYIPCNADTGIDVNTVTSNSGYRHAAVPCVGGDKFTVSAAGGSVGRAWAFIDSNGNLIENAVANATVSNKLLTAPDNAVYLIINDANTGVTSYTGQINHDRINAISYNSKLLDYIWERGSLNTSTGKEVNSNTAYIRVNYIHVSEGDVFNIAFDRNINKAYIYEYSDATYNAFIQSIALDGSSVYIVPNGVEYIRIVFGPIDGSTITTDYAENIIVKLSDGSILDEYAVSVTFTTGNYMTWEGAHAASGWSYTSHIPCAYGQYLRIINSYSTDYRPVFFFNSSDKCVGYYDYGVNNALISEFVVRVPENASYAVVNVASDGRTNLKILLFDSLYSVDDDIACRSWQNISVRTGHKLIDMFSKIKSAGPFFTVVDDDGRNLTQVSNFHAVCTANGVVGCNALATKFIEDMTEADRTAFVSALKSYESDGFQNVLHCYNHNYWESDIVSGKTDAQLFADITADIVHGIRDMESLGFINWRHWVVPQGKTDLSGVEKVARNLGFAAAYDVANKTFNAFANRDNVYRRYSIARMELYPEDTGHGALTLQLIKDQAALCAEQGGWLIVCTHFYQPGWASNDPTFSRVSEMIQYIMGLGFKNVTLSGGMSYWEDIYRMYDMF